MLSGMESSKDFKYMGLFQSRRRSACNLYFAASWLFYPDGSAGAFGLGTRTRETCNRTNAQDDQSHTRTMLYHHVKELALRKAPATAPETIGDVVPGEIPLESPPAQAANKVPPSAISFVLCQGRQ
jgi:hypothetical protein